MSAIPLTSAGADGERVVMAGEPAHDADDQATANDAGEETAQPMVEEVASEPEAGDEGATDNGVETAGWVTEGETTEPATDGDGWTSADDADTATASALQHVPGGETSLVAFLERTEALPQAVRLRERTYSLLALAPDGLTLDVGCGTGRAVAELEERGYPAAGVDVSEKMIAVARERFPDCDVRIAAAEGLPFDDGSVARYRAERVYQYISAPQIALAEAHRVLMPGGRIALIDQDYDMLGIDADDQGLTRVLLRALSASIPQPWAGRRYRNLLLDAGFSEVSVSVEMLTYTGSHPNLATQVMPLLSSIAEAGAASGVAAPEQATGWVDEQKRRAETDRFFAVLPIFVASATRP